MTAITTTYGYMFNFPMTQPPASPTGLAIAAFKLCDGSNNVAAGGVIVINGTAVTQTSLCNGSINMDASPYGKVTIMWNGKDIDDVSDFTVSLNGSKLTGNTSSPLPKECASLPHGGMLGSKTCPSVLK